MKPYLKYLGVVLLASIFALAFYNGAHACTLDGQDPFETGWAIQCSNADT